MRELIQGRAIEELDKLKMKLCLTPDELKIFNKNEDKMKYIRNMKKAEKNETFKNIAEWAVKYNHLKFPKTLQFAPVGYSDGTLRQYFQIAKSYIKDPRPIGRENFTQWLDYFMEEYKDRTEENLIKTLQEENRMLREHILKLESSPPFDLKGLKAKLQNEIDNLYYKLQAIELLESEIEGHRDN